MNIITIYTAKAEKLLDVVDRLCTATNGTVKVMATDPNRLFNNATHDDVPMASVTIYSTEDALTLQEFFDEKDVFVCEEDPSDWA